MKKLLIICCSIFLMFIGVNAQTTTDLGIGMDYSPTYQNVDYYIEGSVMFHERADGTKYLSYDVLGYIEDPIMLPFDEFPIEAYGIASVNGQTIYLDFTPESFYSNYLYNGEGSFYAVGETELDSSVEFSDIGIVMLGADYIFKYFEVAFNW